MNFTDCEHVVTRVLLACYVASGTGERVHRNRPSHGLVLMRDGRNVYKFSNGETRETVKGQLFYLPKFSDYVVDNRDSGSCFAINFDLADSGAAFPYFSLPPDFGARFEPRFASAVSAWSSGRPGYAYAALSELYAILSALRSYCAFADPAAARVARAERELRLRLSDPSLRVSDLAELSGITPEWFRAEFRRAYGVSPVDYLVSLRIERAKELLGSGMFTVNGAAESCGYASGAYFCRDFKRRTGVTPGEYKKTVGTLFEKSVPTPS